MIRWYQRPFWKRPFADRTLCHFLHRRLALPSLSLSDVLDDFNEVPITIREVPLGGWSTPLADVVMLLKLATCARSKRLMEIGSFRGYTALLLAQHTSDDARIVTVDQYAQHGEAYRDTAWAARIERRVGTTGAPLFAADAPGSFDMIFIDADHSYESVRHDTELTPPLIAPGGYAVWHDYANWGYFDGKNGVPELLRELMVQGLPIASIAGSDLAIYSPDWKEGGPGYDRYRTALQSAITRNNIDTDPWTVNLLRG